jgi:(S)-2-hydroxyglutarate dehydrogenase
MAARHLKSTQIYIANCYDNAVYFPKCKPVNLTQLYDFVVIGGGIVGLSAAREILAKYPSASLVLLEKEKELSAHQTGHNSGVIHSGIYYKPGSFKAKFARAGNLSMASFCQEHGIPYDICGKVIVATKPNELSQLESIYQRGLQNEINIKRISAAELREIEPHVAGLSGVHLPAAGIVNYTEVCKMFAKLLIELGGEVRMGHKVCAIQISTDRVIVETNQGVIEAKYLINCAGLYSDRIADMGNAKTDVKIIPFRGEYFELKANKRHLVKHLIYPVPNPNFPFLGVHFTRMIGGQVEAGPNAVLAFAREGYKKTDVNLRDLMEVLCYRGFWALSAKYWKEGYEEMVRSWSKAAFVRSLQTLIPEITADDLVPVEAGIRAQGLKPNGDLVDDFHIVQLNRALHICNAPSPAATASIEIGKYIASKIILKP